MRSLRLRPPQPPPQPDQRLGEIQGSHPRPGPLRVLRGPRTPAGPGGGPHHPQEPGRLRRHQHLQALCFVGVRAGYGHREAGCVFCALEGSGRELLENELALCTAIVALVDSIQR